MALLAEVVELVIGVDTHKDTHTEAVVAAATGVVVTQVTVPATPAGYPQLLQMPACQPGPRVWAIEGAGGYGAGLTRFLQAHAERVVELDRPKRTARRHGAKSDPLDAIRVAREALGRDHLAQPRTAGLNRPGFRGGSVYTLEGSGAGVGSGVEAASYSAGGRLSQAP